MRFKITKKDLVNSVYESVAVDKKDIALVIDSFLLQLRKSLEVGSVIELRGFGTFEPKLRKGRAEARNPRSGEILSVGPHYVAAFRAGKELKEAMRAITPEEGV